MIVSQCKSIAIRYNLGFYLRAFCNKALDILLKWGNLPIKTQNSLRMHIEVCLICSVKILKYFEGSDCF